MASSNPGPTTRRLILVYARAAVLIFSILPVVLRNGLIGGDARWITPTRLAILATLLAAGLISSDLSAAWRLPAVLLAISLAALLMEKVRAAGLLAELLNRIEVAPLRNLFTVQATSLGITLLTILTLLALGFRRRDAFLVRGQIDAPAAPVRWLGFPTPEPWTSFGTKWMIFFPIGMVVILSIFGRPSLRALAGAATSIPVVTVLAALNAF